MVTCETEFKQLLDDHSRPVEASRIIQSKQLDPVRIVWVPMEQCDLVSSTVVERLNGIAVAMDASGNRNFQKLAVVRLRLRGGGWGRDWVIL
jgi:hypothetical protein